MKYIFIVNCRRDKVAIREEVERQLAELEDEFQRNGDSATVYFTTGEGDATREVHLYSDLHPNEQVCFVACGGDGTVNEVASGIVGFEHKSMAILALHSNNDTIKYYPGRCFTSIREILQGDDARIDIIHVNDSYAVNACNYGFDAQVALAANAMAEQNKSNVFRRGIAKAIFFKRYNRIRTVADGVRIGPRYIFSCTLANGRYVGGEFLAAPNAENDDGLIDLCLLKPMLFITFLFMMRSFKRGEHLRHPYLSRRIVYRQVKHITVSSTHLINMCLDGEILPGTNFEIEILPKAITLRLPKPSSADKQ